MAIRFSVVCTSPMLAASLFALSACGGTEGASGETAEADAMAAEAEGDAPATPAQAGSEAAGEDTVAATTKADTGSPAADEFEETVKTARCKVYDPGGDYEGPCQFTTWGSGSFVVSRKGGAEFFNGITEVHVEIDAPGVAGGSIRQAGELNFIGTMERHKDDRACWSSADFTVCAN